MNIATVETETSQREIIIVCSPKGNTPSVPGEVLGCGHVIRFGIFLFVCQN